MIDDLENDSLSNIENVIARHLARRNDNNQPVIKLTLFMPPKHDRFSLSQFISKTGVQRKHRNLRCLTQLTVTSCAKADEVKTNTILNEFGREEFQESKAKNNFKLRECDCRWAKTEKKFQYDRSELKLDQQFQKHTSGMLSVAKEIASAI